MMIAIYYILLAKKCKLNLILTTGFEKIQQDKAQVFLIPFRQKNTTANLNFAILSFGLNLIESRFLQVS